MTAQQNHTPCKGCENWDNSAVNLHGYCFQCWAEKDIDWSAAEQRQERIGQNGNDGLHYPTGPTAPSILLKAREHLKDRAATRDRDDGERSMARTVRIFNAARGRDLTEEEGWLFMIALKIARSQAGGYNADDYDDLAAYSALLGECVGRG